MQEYVIAQGILETTDREASRLKVVYGFLTMPGLGDASRGAVNSRISAISVQSLEGTFISLGRYRLTTNDGQRLLLERNNAGWQVVQEVRLSTLLTLEHDSTFNAAVPK